MSAVAESAGVTAIAPLTPSQLAQRRLASRRHGLWAKSAGETGLRHYRSGRLLRRLEQVLAAEGRPLSEEQVPAARSWAELGVIADQVYIALLATFKRGETPAPKLLDAWRGLQRDRLLHATALGLTPMAKAELANTLSDLKRAQETMAAQSRLRAKQVGAAR